MNYTYTAVQTHLTPSYRLFSILDITPIYHIGAPPLVAVKSATINGRFIILPFPRVHFWGAIGGGTPKIQNSNASSDIFLPS